MVGIFKEVDIYFSSKFWWSVELRSKLSHLSLEFSFDRDSLGRLKADGLGIN